MQAILIAYGTTDGHTASIAGFLGSVLQTGGAQIDIIRVGVDGADPSPERYDAVVVAGSLQAGGYQRSLRRWVRRHAQGLNTLPTAMISVCLGILQKDPKVWADLDARVNRFMEETGWQPSVVKIVAGALLYSHYGWLKRWIMRRITRKAGVDTDPSRDYVYTDWDDLRLFAEGFLRRGSRKALEEPSACCVAGAAHPRGAAT
ncbi:MAG TPA: flavodoxin domain-containing protein [Gemmatimonadales bacterium]